MWAITVPIVIACVESFSNSVFIKRLIAKLILPKIEQSIERHISKQLGKAEQQYEDIIISQIKDEIGLLQKCRSYLGE